MDENRLQAYLQLIQALLDCPNGEEPQILQANSQLLDRGFLQTCEGVAVQLAEEGEENGANFLRNLATQVGSLLGLTSSGDNIGSNYRSNYIEFLQLLIQIENKNFGRDSRHIYAVLQANLDKLNFNLIPVLKQTWAEILGRIPEKAEGFAALIENIAIRIQEFPRGSRADNQEIAIAAYEIVLSVRTLETNREKWAQTQNNLANAYYFRIRGERAENIEMAISFCKAALEVRTREAFPQQWAMTQHNLANAYYSRIRGERAENIEMAISSFTAALEVRTREAFPQDWAETQHNLAAAYYSRIRGERVENIEMAISFYTAPLEVYTREAFPERWAEMQNNLANAYKDRIRGERVENIERAIACYNAALEVCTREAFPQQWAMTQNNLAIAYCYSIRGKRADNIERAILRYRQALEIYTPSAFPLNCLQTGRNLGNFAFDLQDWENAIYGYENAISAVEQSREWATSQRRKRQILEDALPIYEKMVLACIAVERYDLALLTVERSKSRTLIELLDNANLYPQNATENQKQRLSELRSQMNSLQQQLDRNEPPKEPKTDAKTEGNRNNIAPEKPQSVAASLETELKTLQQQLAQLLEEIDDPNFNLTQKVIPQLPDFTQLLDTQTALIEWYLPPNPESGFHVFIVTISSSQPSLPFLFQEKSGEDRFNQWLAKGKFNTGLGGQFVKIDRLSFTPENRQQLDADIATYRSDYRQSTWGDALSSRLATLAESLHLNEVLAKLPPTTEKLVLIPHRDLHLLPLHALQGRRLKNGEPQTGYLLDLFPNGVQYAPSSQFLDRLHQRQRQKPNKPPLFAIQNPTEDLRYTEIEVETISQSFNPDTHILKRRQATKIAFNTPETLAQLSRAYYAHFSCHGSFDASDPLNSALILAKETATSDSQPASETPESDQKYVTIRDGRRFDTATQGLTLKEIFANLKLPLCRLVTLSACETGLVDSKFTDEYIGLASGFLYAGATNVVSSLWSVSDLSTAFLMIRFYQELPNAPSIAVAIQSAQKWLKSISRQDFLNWLQNELKMEEDRVADFKILLRRRFPHSQPFSHPQYWAAFCAIGL